jgi:transposase
MSLNDPEINQGVRQVLTRNWFDLSKTNFASRRGIVRMMGELKKLGRDKDAKLEPAHLEQLDCELRRLKGVERVHFDLANWQRNEEGEWVPVEVQREAQEVQNDRGAGVDLNRIEPS